MKVQNCFLRLNVFFFEDKAANKFAFIVSDCEIDTLDEVSVNEFLFGANGVDIVWIFGGGDDAFPGAFEVDLQCFHK